MAQGNGGPWGGGGNRGGSGGGNDGGDGGDRRPPPLGNRPRGQGSGVPEFEEIMNKGRERLRVLMGGGGNGSGPGGGSGRGSGPGDFINRTTVLIGIGLLALLWLFNSFYTVRPEERSVELFLGSYSQTGEPGLNFAPWPLVTYEIVPVTREQTIDIGSGRSGSDAGLMLTGDENIVDIDFQVVWNITDPAKYLFNLADPETTIEAVAESAMREIIAQSELGPILNRDRGVIADRLLELVQSTLDSYDSGVNIIRVNLQAVEPPSETVEYVNIDNETVRTSPLDAFRDVQDAEQERDQLQNQADAYANRVLAEARGEAARILEESEGYRAQVVNQAQGEASRFLAVLAEYATAPEVTRKRLYLETMESVLGGVDIVLLDEGAGGGSGVVPYLPLNELNRRSGGSN